MADRDALRVLVDGALPGAVNMAADEAILEAVNTGAAPATLRFYRWEEPTISLGYFQRHEELNEQDEAVRCLPVVRRQTGGGAILHDDELTYSLVVGLDGRDGESIESLYQVVHDAYVGALGALGVAAAYRGGRQGGNAQRGPFFCFARKHRLDLVVGQDKLLGSAQRRMKHAALQHGSLILGRHFEQQPSASVEGCTRQAVALEAFIEAVTVQIGGALGLQATAGELTAAELERREALVAKYSGAEWIRQR